MQREVWAVALRVPLLREPSLRPLPSAASRSLSPRRRLSFTSRRPDPVLCWKCPAREPSVPTRCHWPSCPPVLLHLEARRTSLAAKASVPTLCRMLIQPHAAPRGA